MQSLRDFALDAAFVGAFGAVALAALLAGGSLLVLPWLIGAALCATCGVGDWVGTIGLALSAPWALILLGSARVALHRAPAC